jgi:hydrogenase nickel incorporation protein HypA/HybF
MHELSIAVSIVDVAMREACRHAGNTVAVHMNLGAFSGVVKDSLLSAWLLARVNSPLENAELVVTEIDAVAFCPECNAERGITSMQQLCCSQCASPVTKIIHGRELEIIALEFDA